VPVFDALDGPKHATLRPAVRDRRLFAWIWSGMGVAAVVALLVLGDVVDAVEALVVAALFGAFMWLTDYRWRLRKGLAAPQEATDEATLDLRRRGRPVVAAGAFVLLCVVSVVLDITPPVGIALGMGAVELAAVMRLRGWERRNQRTLFSAGSRLSELYTR
jgi:hypothetical protein